MSAKVNPDQLRFPPGSTLLVIGSGPIIIGQACEFDYSGTQACKALKELGYRVVLINSNPATIMTDEELADATYVEPLTVEAARQVIAREKPVAVLPTVGGQVGLNLALALHEQGVLEEHGCMLIGADPEALKEARTWRDGPGQLLLKELWEQVDAEPLLEALEAVSEGGASDEEVEEALFDLDDLIVAAIWCRQREAVAKTAAKAERIVRDLPDLFEDVADVAKDLLRRREVGEDLELYGFWLAVAEGAGE